MEVRRLGATCQVLGAWCRCLVLSACVLGAVVLGAGVLGTGTFSTALHAQEKPADAPLLTPTNHPRLPADASQLWMAPDAIARAHTRSASSSEFATAVKLEVDSNYAKALPIFLQPAVKDGPLASYAEFYAGLAELRLGRAAEARTRFRALRDSKPIGFLNEGAALREAEADEALGDHSAALAVYESLAAGPLTMPDDLLMRLAREAHTVGDNDKAANAYARIVYEFPLSDLAPLAATEMESLPNVQAIAPGTQRYKLELGRAERLFGSKRYAQARTAFEGLRSASSGDDRELVNLRLAECDYFLKRPRNARDGVKPYTEHASRQGEALFFHAVAVRELGDESEYERTVRRIVTDFPEQSWAEEALNNLATHFIVQDDDDRADATFRELYEKYPKGRYAERAAWKIGWQAYKSKKYAETTRIFERAAGDFPRSDYRPMWLYWSGRSCDALGAKTEADARYTLVATDYLNSYYGRLATKRLRDHGAAIPRQRLVLDTTRDGDGQEIAGVSPLPENATVIRALLALELYDQALDELRYAQKAWGDSPAIQATLGYVLNRRGDLRAGINAMKRAYPQYMAAGGEQIPAELLRVLFPVNYWSMIRRYAGAHDLDPYVMAALIAQESTFTPDVKSAANAYGLMQLLPSTGKIYARRTGMRYSSRLLTTAEPNLKMGMAFFADLVGKFGGTHYALASYNAGDNRIARWKAERPDMDREEWIDDIPFPETQNYVKKILGTAEDYRRLYPATGGSDDNDSDATPALATGKPAPVKKASASTSATKHSTASSSSPTSSSKVEAPKKKTSKKPAASKKKKSKKSRKSA